MLESKLVRDWMHRLRAMHFYSERHSAMGGGERIGLPDMECCIDGHFMSVEAKRDFAAWKAWMDNKSEQSPTQKRCIADIRAANGVAFCTWRWADIELAVTAILNGESHQAINAAVDKSQQEFRNAKNIRSHSL